MFSGVWEESLHQRSIRLCGGETLPALGCCSPCPSDLLVDGRPDWKNSPSSEPAASLINTDIKMQQGAVLQAVQQSWRVELNAKLVSYVSPTVLKDVAC